MIHTEENMKKAFHKYLEITTIPRNTEITLYNSKTNQRYDYTMGAKCYNKIGLIFKSDNVGNGLGIYLYMNMQIVLKLI